jgi:hypothetical protein
VRALFKYCRGESLLSNLDWLASLRNTDLVNEMLAHLEQLGIPGE